MLVGEAGVLLVGGLLLVGGSLAGILGSTAPRR